MRFQNGTVGPLAVGTVNPGAGSRDVLVSWHSMKRSFRCCIWAQGSWYRLQHVPGEHDTVTGYVT